MRHAVFYVFVMITLSACVELNQNSRVLPSSTIFTSPTITSVSTFNTPKITPSPIQVVVSPFSKPTKMPIPNSIVGKWYFITETTKQSEIKQYGFDDSFYIIFRQDGTLLWKFRDTDKGISGTWNRQGNSIDFEIANSTTWEGTINDNIMIGTFSNIDGIIGTWKATYQP
jgi:hypothetical protein